MAPAYGMVLLRTGRSLPSSVKPLCFLDDGSGVTPTQTGSESPLDTLDWNMLMQYQLGVSKLMGKLSILSLFILKSLGR